MREIYFREDLLSPLLSTSLLSGYDLCHTGERRYTQQK